MDALVLFFIAVVSSVLSLIGFLFKEPGVGSLGGLGFLILGFSFLTAGIDVNTQSAYSTNLNATDFYAYNWNSTYNQSTIANVTTSYNKTQTTTFAYVNVNDQWTATFAVVSIFAGLAIAYAAWFSWNEARKNKPGEENG